MKNYNKTKFEANIFLQFRILRHIYDNEFKKIKSFNNCAIKMKGFYNNDTAFVLV